MGRKSIVAAVALCAMILAGCASQGFDPHVGGPRIARESALVANGGYVGGPSGR